MSELFKICYFGSIVTGLLISINCYAQGCVKDCVKDSAGISKWASNLTKLTPVRPEIEADLSQCQEERPVTSNNYKHFYTSYNEITVSACPRDYPIANTIGKSRVVAFWKGPSTVYLKCCKARSQY